MSQEFDALSGKVKALESSVTDAMALLDKLAAMIKNIPANPDAAAMTTLSAEVDASIQALKDKIAADTPA